MAKNNNHIFVTDTESEEPLTYKVDETGIMLDLKVLLKEYYVATFTQNENELEIVFSNGQTFRLGVREIKA